MYNKNNYQENPTRQVGVEPFKNFNLTCHEHFGVIILSYRCKLKLIPELKLKLTLKLLRNYSDLKALDYSSKQKDLILYCSLALRRASKK